MSDASDETPAEAEGGGASAKAAAKGGGASKVPLILGVVNIAATGFLVFKALTAPPPTAHAGAPAAPAHVSPAISGPVVPLEPFVINLKDEGISRYLRATFEVELLDAKAVADLRAGMKLVRDAVLRYLSDLEVADTLGAEAKDAIQVGVLARISEVLGEHRARRLFFTEFVVQ